MTARLVLDDFGKIVGIVVAHRRVERRGADGRGAHLRHARGGGAQFGGQFLVGRFAAQFLLQLHRRAAHLGNFVHQMHRQPDGLGLVGQRAFDGLLDPPRAVGGKLAALFRVKAFDGLHQADVAFADQIQQRQADALVVAGDFHDQAQVGLDHVFARFFVALLDPGGEFNFLLRREQFHLADFAQIKADGRVAVMPFGFAAEERAWCRPRSGFGPAHRDGTVMAGGRARERLGAWTRAEIFFFRRTGAGLRLFFFAAMNGGKVKPWPRGRKQINSGCRARRRCNTAVAAPS